MMIENAYPILSPLPASVFRGRHVESLTAARACLGPDLDDPARPLRSEPSVRPLRTTQGWRLAPCLPVADRLVEVDSDGDGLPDDEDPDDDNDGVSDALDPAPRNPGIGRRTRPEATPAPDANPRWNPPLDSPGLVDLWA